MSFRPRVLAVERARELRWKGKLFLDGLFDGEHIFLIHAWSEKEVVLRHVEAFTGLLVPLARRSLEATRAGFVLMNEALKREAEAR